MSKKQQKIGILQRVCEFLKSLVTSENRATKIGMVITEVIVLVEDVIKVFSKGFFKNWLGIKVITGVFNAFWAFCARVEAIKRFCDVNLKVGNVVSLQDREKKSWER